MPKHHHKIGTEALGRMVRVNHKFGGSGNPTRISRGRLVSVDGRREEGEVEPFPRLTRTSGTVTVPLAYLEVDKTTEARRAEVTGGAIAVVVGLARVDHPAHIANRPPAYRHDGPEEPEDVFEAKPVEVAPPAGPPPSLAETLDRLGVLAAELRNNERHQAVTLSAMADAERAYADAAAAKAVAEDAHLDAMAEGDQIRAAVRSVHATLGDALVA